ncbi:MAG: hypothetical protein KDA28_13990 [Phycisphaerales bacterium]|nr:hypothetical protein [Phycisphaerales bacterium]
MRTLLPLALTIAPIAALADVNIPAVVPDDDASISLVALGSTRQGFINSGGETPVRIGEGFQSIGSNLDSTDTLLARWDEYTSPTVNTIEVIVKTEFGAPILPFGSTISGENAFFLSWHFGTEDAVDFQWWLSEADLVKGTAFLSEDGGQSFTQSDITSSLNDPWDGRDNGGSPQPWVGDGNYLLLRYEYTIPAPGALAALAGLAVVRRRR